MKIVFAGSDPRSPIPFRALREAGFCVAAVLTQPDKPTGRKRVLTPNPMKVAAQEAGVRVFDFARVRDHAAALAAVGADCMVTCAYGQILTADVLAAFPRGVFNVHTSLLPRWRGASPIQSAILAGDAETGVTIMRTELGLDTGDVLLRARLPFFDSLVDKKNNFYPDRLKKQDPALAQRLDEEMGSEVKQGPLSIKLLNRLLRLAGGRPEDESDLLERCERLNKAQRNDAAHALHAVTDDDIRGACGYTSARLLRELQALLERAYPECAPSLFDVYEQCEAYIRKRL